jgi:single-stranded-DNA-specific exonuclease
MQEADPELSRSLCSELGISRTTANVLVNRGIKNKDEAESFLRVSLDDLIEPFTLRDMDKVVARVLRAIRDDEKILIYGDYDADGITSTALLVEFFRDIGKEVSYYIPQRLEDGYGISLKAIQQIHSEGVNLIITVDCGVSSVNEVAAASKLGMDMIITDHHEPPEVLPEPLALINPYLKGSNYPFTGLAGVGVALKLVQCIKARLDGMDKAGPGIDPGLHKYLDLVALGTIADVVPLRGENRILVKHGLVLLKEGRRVGIAKLKEVAQVSNNNFGAGSVGFQLAPRLNASGRLGKASIAVRLLITDDPDEAVEIARELDLMNHERQKIEELILDEARNIILNDLDPDARTIVLSSDKWHQGVIGIVASKIVEEFYKPTVLISCTGSMGKGSARSIPAFHLYNGIEQCSRHLEAFGGHKFAAGLSIKTESLAAFVAEFERIAAETLEDEDFIPSIKIEGELGLKDLTWELHEELAGLAPFGPGNPEPVLKSRGLDVMYPKVVGRNHVRMRVSQDGCSFGSIGFNMGGIYQSLAMRRVCVDAVYCLSVNEWQGERSLQLNLKDLHF